MTAGAGHRAADASVSCFITSVFLPHPAVYLAESAATSQGKPQETEEEAPPKGFVYKGRVELTEETLESTFVHEIEAQCTFILDDAQQALQAHRSSYKDFLRQSHAKKQATLRQLRDEVGPIIDLARSLATDFLRAKMVQADASEEDDGFSHAEYFTKLAPIAVRAQALESSLNHSLLKLDDDEEDGD